MTEVFAPVDRAPTLELPGTDIEDLKALEGNVFNLTEKDVEKTLRAILVLIRGGESAAPMPPGAQTLAKLSLPNFKKLTKVALECWEGLAAFNGIGCNVEVGFGVQVARKWLQGSGVILGVKMVCSFYRGIRSRLPRPILSLGARVQN